MEAFRIGFAESKSRDVVFQKKYEESLRNQKRIVSVAFEFVRIGAIDTMNEKFEAEVNIESTWPVILALSENHDIFNNYDPEKHWNPCLFVENAMNAVEEISYEIFEEKKMFYMKEIRKVKGFFWAKMRLNHFPVDVQELEVVLTSKLGNDKVDIVEDLDQISFIDLDAAQTFRDQQKWKLFLLVTTSDEPSYEDNDNQSDIYETTNIKHRHMKQIISARKRFKPAKISGKCYVARKPGYFLINAYLLVFFITVLSTAIFAINFSLTHFRLLSTYVILLTSVSFKWVVNRSLPPVSYLTSLDAYQISSVVFICCEGIWHSIIGAPHLVPRGTGINVDPWIHIVFTILFVLMQFVFVVWLYYAYDKVRKIKLKEKLYFHDHRDYFSVPNSTHLPNLKLPNFGKNIINFHH